MHDAEKKARQVRTDKPWPPQRLSAWSRTIFAQLVDAAATGAWDGEGGKLAVWSDGGWRFAPPRPGMRVVRLPDGAWLRYHAGAWVAPDAIASPAGGVTIDSEARSAIAALILLLEAQGILISG